MVSKRKSRRGKKRKGRIVKSRKKGQKPWEPVKMKLFELPDVFPDSWSQEKKIEIMREVGKQAKEEFDKRYPSISKWFTEYDSLYLLSFCAIYFLTYPEGTDPEAYEGKLDFYHHYLEIMQAFALTQTRTISPIPLGEEAEKLKTQMKEIGDLMIRRGFNVPSDATEEQVREHVLMWRMRNQTTAIRNWAYPQQMLKLTKDLFKSVRYEFLALHAIDPEKLIDLVIVIMDEVENRLNSHLAKVRRFMRMRNYKKIIRTYNETWPDMIPIDEKEGERLYIMAGQSTKNLKAILHIHSDLRLQDIYTFSLDDMLRLLGDKVEKDVLRKVLNGLSLEFGELSGYKTEYFILDNPVLKKPFIKLGEDTYFSAMIGILPHLTLVLLEGLISNDNELRERYNKRRAEYLVDMAEELLKKHFPHGEVFRGSQWKDQTSGREYENDLTVIIDSFAIVVECKAGAVTDPAKRGASLRFKRTLEDLILEPAEQTKRFIEYLKCNRGINVFRALGGGENRIDSTKVEYYIPLGITMEDLGCISCNVKEAIRAGVIKRKIQSLIPSISVSALECLFELLENEIEKIHYLSRRREFEHHVDFIGDELDLLGFYLENGFNIGSVEYTGLALVLAGKSKELDPYFVAKAAGKKLNKPSLLMTKWWKDIINRVCKKRPNHWTMVGYMMLNSTKEDQEKFEYELMCLKSRLNRGTMDHDYNWISFLSGPEQRRYFIVGFPYKNLVRSERNSVIQEIFNSQGRQGARGAVCIGMNMKTKEYPYSFLAADMETHLLEAQDISSSK